MRYAPLSSVGSLYTSQTSALSEGEVGGIVRCCRLAAQGGSAEEHLIRALFHTYIPRLPGVLLEI